MSSIYILHEVMVHIGTLYMTILLYVILSLGVTLGAVCSKREMLANFGPLKLKLQNMDSMDSMDLRIPERCGEKCLD